MVIVRRIAAILLCSMAVAGASAEPVAAVYKAKCALCHGAVGDANTQPGKTFKIPSFSDEAVMKETDATLLEIEKSGKGKMPAWKDKLSDGQLKELVAFIHTLQKK